jgi:group I intron endonuclease
MFDGKIYVITNTLNGMKYVGMTSQILEKRFRAHASKSGGGCKGLSRAIHLYGVEKFKIELLERSACINKIGKRERFWIKNLSTMRPDGYNVHAGGKGSMRSREYAQLYLPVICVTTGITYNSITETAIRNNANVSKVAAVCKGKRNSTKNLKFKFVDDLLNAEAQKLIANRIQRKLTESQRRSISGRKGAASRLKNILCLETGQIFESAPDVERTLGICRSNVLTICKGRQDTLRGLSFRYLGVDDYLRGEETRKIRKLKAAENKKIGGHKTWITRRKNNG